jgi:hypothetical protein
VNFTFQQKLTMAMGFVGAATSAFGALNPLMTSTSALIGTVVLGFVSACLAVVATVSSSQGNQIKTVAAMPGVDRITMNASASPAAAQVATDPQQPKVSGTSREVQQVLQETAKGA